MSLGKQMQRFQQQTAAFRQETFGTQVDETPVTLDYNQGEATDVEAYYSSIKERHQTEQASFLEMHDAMVRIVKPVSFTPAIDALILIKEGDRELLLRIDEILGTHPLSAEWILGCKAQN